MTEEHLHSANKRDSILQRLWNNPRVHSVIRLLFAVLSGIFSSGLVNDLNGGGVTVWSFQGVRNSNSFFLLLALLALFIVYEAFYERRERDILLYGNDEFCLAKAREELFPALLERAKADIAQGKAGYSDINKLLKETKASKKK